MAWTLMSVDILLTGGRLYIHWKNIKKIRLDDIFNVIALLFLLGFMITWQCAAPPALELQMYKMGLSSKAPQHFDAQEALRYQTANLVLYWCLKSSVKGSFVALYWYIFDFCKRFRITWVLLTIYTILSFLITLLAIFWHCGSPTTVMDLSTLAKSLCACKLTHLLIRIIAACEHSRPRALRILYFSGVLDITGNLICE